MQSESDFGADAASWCYQGIVNNPHRTQDLEDIRALLRANKEVLNMEEIRECFRLLNKEQLLDELIQQL